MKGQRVLSMLLAAAILLTASAACVCAENDKYEQAIDIHFVRWVDETFQATVGTTLPGQTIDNNFWLDAYRDELGINVIYDWISSAAEYNQKLNLSMAGMELPDAFTVNTTQLAQLAEAEMIQPVGELLEKYGSDLLKDIMYQEGDAGIRSAFYQGSLYALPNMGGSIDSADVMWVRNDWLTELNIPAPTSIDAFHDMLKAFAAHDFDGNGEQDSVGMIIAGVDPWGSVGAITPIFNAFGAYPNLWIVKDNALAYGSVQPEMREALVFLHELYQEGLLDKEFIVKDGGTASEYLVNEKCGVIFGKQWLPIWPLNNSYYSDNGAEWIACEIPSATGETVKGQMSLGVIDYLVINANFEHPEALVKMMNLFVEKCWGATGDNAVYYAPPTFEGVWKLSPVYPTSPLKNIEAFRALEDARATGDYSNVKGEARSIQDKLELFAQNTGDSAGVWGWTRIYGPAPTPYSIFDTRLAENRTVMNAYLGAPTETMIERGGIIASEQNQVFLKIIIGEEDISAFDQFVEDFYAMGGKAMTEEANDWFSVNQ